MKTENYKYIGGFLDGKKHCKNGKLIVSGKTFEGEWMDNKPVGNFTKIDNGDEKLYSFGDDGKLKVMQK